MKNKIIIFCVSYLLLLSLIVCNSKKNKHNSSTSSVTETTAVTEITTISDIDNSTKKNSNRIVSFSTVTTSDKNANLERNDDEKKETAFVKNTQTVLIESSETTKPTLKSESTTVKKTTEPDITTFKTTTTVIISTELPETKSSNIVMDENGNIILPEV